jgi:isoleucyl-tRNA synthetase
LAECKGSDLIGIRYEQLMKLALPYQNPENAFRVIAGDFVTTEDGTGIVHTAPTFGADDAKVAKEASPEVPPMLVLDENGNLVPLVDLQGKFIQGLGQLSSQYVKNEYYNDNEAPERSADVAIAIQLKEENKAQHTQTDSIFDYFTLGERRAEKDLEYKDAFEFVTQSLESI